MAIKGKKKSQKRGSQARRRPAAPPRQVVQQRQSLPWHKNPRIVGALGLLVIVAIGVIVWAVQDSSKEQKALEKRQETLDGYTDEIRAVVQGLRAPAGLMAAAPTALEDPEAADKLAEDAADWSGQFEQSLQDFGKIVPSTQGSIENVHSLYNQAIQIYLTAAKSFELAAETEDKAQQDAFSLAATQRTEAGTVWTEATALLDEERRKADLELSGLTAPEAPAGGTAPGTSPTGLPQGEIPSELTPPEEPGGGGGDKSGGNDGGQKGSGANDGGENKGGGNGQ